VLAMFASGGLLLVLDQCSKNLVQLYVRGRPVSCGPVQIRYVANLKTFYRSDRTRAALVVMWFAALLSAVLLHRSGGWFQGTPALLSLGLAFGGAAGNLSDILRLSYVVDFIDLHWWPVFNLADLAIVAGLAGAFWRPI